jgi:hypothetical protein
VGKGKVLVFFLREVKIFDKLKSGKAKKDGRWQDRLAGRFRLFS